MLVHVGFAISKVDEEEAARTYKYLEEMDQLRGNSDDRIRTAMKYLDEYRDHRIAQKIVDEIKRRSPGRG